jgi:anti-sigma-K factor RskA
MKESHIERLLGSLKPVSPSPELLERVEHDMELQSFFRHAGTEATPTHAESSKPNRTSTWHVPVAWASVGAAAAAALVISLMPPREAVSSPALAVNSKATATQSVAVGNAANATPVSTNRQVLSAEDRGIIYPTAAQPTRQIRVRYLERRLFLDTATGEQRVVEVPVEEIISVPVEVQ